MLQKSLVLGSVSARGLIPSNSPVFIDEFLDEYEPRPKSINASRYADLIRERAGPAVVHLYPENNCLQQDDPATIHRASVSIEAVNETLRIPHDIQAAKMADI